MFTIDKNIPIPEGDRGAKKYPLDQMAIGDSFLVADGQKRRTVNQAVQYYQKKSGKRFTVRQVEDGIRVWRVA